MPYVTAYDEHTEEIEALAAKILTPELAAALKKKLSDELTPIWEAAVDEVIEGAAESVSRVAADRAKRFLESVLKGDAKAAENLFGLSGFNGRSEPGRGLPDRPVIHGKVFESDPIELRRKLVEAHADLLRDARIADLEDLLEGARRQVAEYQQRETKLSHC
jgi:predicted house-cleaning noncanonical NTP pyrophosphatase (MazG superfamily)